VRPSDLCPGFVAASRPAAIIFKTESHLNEILVYTLHFDGILVTFQLHKAEVLFTHLHEAEAYSVYGFGSIPYHNKSCSERSLSRHAPQLQY